MAAAVMLAHRIAAAHLRAVRSVKCKQSPSFALATCACRRCAEPCDKLPPGDSFSINFLVVLGFDLLLVNLAAFLREVA